MSFLNYNVVRSASKNFNTWAGLKNYLKIFADENFVKAVGNTVKWTAVNLVFQVTFAMLLALALNKKLRGRSAFRTLSLIPWAVPHSIATMTFTFLLSPNVGIINMIAVKLGILAEPMSFLGNISTAFWSVCLESIWKGIPFQMIFILAALQGIPGSVYESSQIDGANKWQTFWRITLPMIKQPLAISVRIEMKALIVEDELLARIGLRQAVDWEVFGIELLEDARDGEEAVSKIECFHPDIIFLDLNIPKKTGMEILDYLKETRNPAKAIIITAYEDFDTVKAALKKGAFDYLRKLNLDMDELKTILRKCKDEISAGGEPERYITYIRYSQILLPGGRENIFKKMGSKLLVSVVPQLNSRQDNNMFMEQCDSYFRREYPRCVRLEKDMSNCYYLFSEEVEESYFLAFAQDCLAKLGIPVYVGIASGDINDVESLNYALARADQILICSFYDEEKKVNCFGQELEVQSKCPRQVQELYENFKEDLASFREGETLKGIKEIIESICGMKYVELNVIRHVFIDILGCYSTFARTMGGSIDDISIDGDNLHYQVIMQILSMSKVKDWFEKFNGIFFEKFRVSYKCSQSELLKKAVEYVDRNIYKPIRLWEAAESIGVSDAYLSTVFKKDIGENFISYVNHRKLEIARELLKNGKMIYEVSEQLGYENVTYFSKLFKRTYGISAEQYKKQ